MKRSTKTSCSTIMAQKKAKVWPPPRCSANQGKVKAMTVAITQWVLDPRACPLARTALGKISEINTQMTAPCEKAKKPMYTNSSTGTV